MLSLRVEIAACLFAVGLLGLLCGWMMQRVRARRRLRRTVADWEARYAELERSTQQDEINLEERLQSLGQKLRTVEAENRTLRAASSGEKESLDTARTEAIELNRRQTETQERLQRIIREREREIAALRAGVEPSETRETDVASASEHAAAPVARRAERPAGRAVAGEDDATLALLGGEGRGAEHDELMAVIDGFDETIRLDPSMLPSTQQEEKEADAADGPEEDASEDPDEATVALDEETLALVRARGERAR